VLVHRGRRDRLFLWSSLWNVGSSKIEGGQTNIGERDTPTLDMISGIVCEVSGY